MHFYIQFVLSLVCSIFLRRCDMCNILFHWLGPCSENWSRRTGTRLCIPPLTLLGYVCFMESLFQHDISVLSYLKHKTMVIHCYFDTMHIKIAAWDLCHLSDLHNMIHSIRNIISLLKLPIKLTRLVSSTARGNKIYPRYHFSERDISYLVWNDWPLKVC